MQVGIILAVMLLVRKGLEPVIIILRKVFKRDNKPWDSCIEAALLREVPPTPPPPHAGFPTTTHDKHPSLGSTAIRTRSIWCLL